MDTLYILFASLTFVALVFALLSQQKKITLLARTEEQLKLKDETISELKNKILAFENQEKNFENQISELSKSVAILETQLREQEKQFLEKLKIFSDAENKMVQTFQALSSETLKANSTSFLELAKESLTKHQQESKTDLEHRQKAIDSLVKPLIESLEKVDVKIQDIEKQRIGAYSALLQQLEFLGKGQEKLQTETGNLINALKAPQVRGRWGEMTLKRVAELAGMIEHCDFIEQESKNTDSGRLRPDMIVKIAGNKQIVIDAKVPLASYLQALESKSDEERERYFEDHARQLFNHMKQLGQKSYWDQFNPTPEFVVMFVPGESFYSAALSRHHTLIDEGMQMKVMLASPTNLVSLLKTISYGWRQEQLAQNAEEISQVGKVLYERLVNLSNHFADLGQALRRSQDAYNNAIGTLESRVLTQARKFETLGVKGKNPLPELVSLDMAVRHLHAPELLTPLESNQNKKVD